MWIIVHILAPCVESNIEVTTAWTSRVQIRLPHFLCFRFSATVKLRPCRELPCRLQPVTAMLDTYIMDDPRRAPNGRLSKLALERNAKADFRKSPRTDPCLPHPWTGIFPHILWRTET